MTINTLEGEEYLPFDSIFLNDQINRIIEEVLPKFNWAIKKYVLFHCAFIFLAMTELTVLIFFAPLLLQSSLLSAGLGVLFLTVFSYFLLRLYVQTKKPEHFLEIKRGFIDSCKGLIQYRNEIPEHHLALAKAAARFAEALQGEERTHYRFPRWLDFLDPTMEKVSAFCHWQDVHSMREILLLISVEEHIQLVKFEPTSLEVHAALANAYVSLSSLYMNPYREGSSEEDRILGNEKMERQLKKKYTATAQRAVEELKIINDFAPDDPWVHVQLAYSYHDLGMPEEEIKEHETILRLCPDDNDTLFKLGILYFEQGLNAKGLEVYEQLRDYNYKKAEQLIAHYGAYTQTNPLIF